MIMSKSQNTSEKSPVKGGVDVVDLLSTTHTTRIKSRRWLLNALAFILDTCRFNA